MSKIRYDSVGIFWQDAPVARRNSSNYVRPLPEIPDTGWRPPQEFPNLRGAKVLSIDCETKDPELRTLGPGIHRGAHIVGLAVGTDDGHRWYFPMRHEVGGGNMDPQQVLRWARDNITRPGVTKVGANIRYDLEFLAHEGVHVQGPFIDVLVDEALIDENRLKFDLDSIAEDYLGQGKVDNALYEWCALAYGGKPNRSQAGNIYRAPVSLVGPYAEGDVDLPLRLMVQQQKKLDAENLNVIASVERRLLPLLVAMRQHGVRIDVGRIDAVNEAMQQSEQRAQARLNELADSEISVWAAQDLAGLFDKYEIYYPKTDKGTPSFTKDFLQITQDIASPVGREIAQYILAVRKWSKNRSTFVEGHILRHLIEDRVYTEFHQAKGDEYGSIARFSSSRPNLQNIPKRDKELMRYLRCLFIPEEGERWRRYDYSQIEYRFLVHFARGLSGQEAKNRYNTDPTTDFHGLVHDLIKEITLKELEREPTKTINFGLVYGMQLPKLSTTLGLTMDATQELFNAYHEGAPFVKDLFDFAQARAGARGYVRTILGRRARFEQWNHRSWKIAKVNKAMSKEAAVTKWGRQYIKRAFTHKGLSRVLQGSAADLIKKAMADIWDSGVCDVVGPPLLTVHDELGFSDPQTKEAEEAFGEVKYLMENAIDLSIPVMVEQEVGPNWGELELLQ